MENHANTTNKRTLAGEIAFLMLSFPLGLAFFIVTVVGFSLGMGTLVIWIGLAVLFATLYTVHGMAAAQRNLVRSLLHMPHPDQPYYGRAPVRGFLRRFGALLRDPYTWTGLIYMLFISMPLGIVNFVLTLTSTLVSVSLTVFPLVYLINVYINSILLRNGVSSPQGFLIPYFVEIHGGFDPLMFMHSFAAVPLGLVLCYLTRLLIRALASFSGVLSNAMLGPGTAAYTVQPHALNYIPPMRMMEQQVSLD